MNPLVDPRRGDIEDDASSTKRRSMLSLAGSLFAEISPAKLVLSWTMLFVLPGLLLGLTPLIVSAWIVLIKDRIASPLIGIWPILLLAFLAVLGLWGARSVLRLAESSFWALNAIVVEPVYAICRETMRHLTGKLFTLRTGQTRSFAFSIFTSMAAGAIMFCAAAGIAWLAWPASRWLGTVSDLASPRSLVSIALANSVVLVTTYLAIASLIWAYADAIMPQPRDFNACSGDQNVRRKWRLVHLSDLHAVGERYGFRIESGRSGPRGNIRLRQILAKLDVIHSRTPVDVVLITGDLTDAGRSAEWSELLDELQKFPRLLERILILPGNHDLNIVDRANPARLDLPTSPNRRLRRLRFLSAADFIQGQRVRVIDQAHGHVGASLSAALEPNRVGIARFSDIAKPLLARRLDDLWATAFPMIVPPDSSDGLGIVLLNSNADTHFSFTNALGMMTSEQMRGIEIAAAQYPKACWVLALHHHVVEYPRPAKVLSERIGTALVNGSWFVRRLRKVSGRVVLMHGHRHTDWLGECENIPIVSAPSPVMEATDEEDSFFYIHTLGVSDDHKICLLSWERVTVEGEVST
ncbi:metallophosphoesterase [Bradyrhizobium sp. LHD-71]|uniref:metallophosphoesterase family protein n=1 Tax=Bradyrhizobium sp. LHD-71 TaxID=3072141 RepID=UPI0028102216|nr:metallophosphoesterase [Bradyrhizobium sp. LHD-71]MDQ8731129.1 metallophosphoesterase [Bradyrhizobium sp. LHD-71]